MTGVALCEVGKIVLLYIEIIDVGEVGAGLLCERGIFGDFGVVDVVLGCVYGGGIAITVTVDNLEVVTGVVFGAEGAKKGADGLGGGAATADAATNVFWVYGEGEKDAFFVDFAFDGDFVGVVD